MDELALGPIVARMASALVLGAIVGLERQRKHRPAGFRTLTLVSVGSAAFMLTAGQLVVRVTPTPGVPDVNAAEISRVLQGLIGGIGFLGAGAVIQSQRAVHGMTTAASIWVTAAIGAASGLGLFMLAAIVAGATMFTLVGLEWVEDRLFPKDGTENEENAKA